MIPDVVPERIEADTLRKRWIALFDKMKEVNDACRGSKEVWQLATGSVVEPESPALDGEVRQALLEYQTCVGPTMDELRALRDVEPGLDALFDLNDLFQRANSREGASRLNWEVRRSFWLNAALGDDVGVLDAFNSLSYLATYEFAGFRYFDWSVGEVTNWLLLKPTIEDGSVDEQQWNRLNEILDVGRSQQHFLKCVRRDTAWIVASFETWADDLPSFKFSEAPVTYVRSWAYPRITPALFNHDFDRFNRAMDRLLDLAERPYFEVKDDLARFCEDFDVEPDIDSLKFTHGNPGWYYVLNLSRHEFEQNARNQASIDVIRFAILLEKHKRESGNYPESLDVFADALGGSLPVNPLMGDAYVYERTEDSFQLGFRQETVAELVALGVDPVTVTWWHDPLGLGTEENFE
jgi:hypothetical protein